MTYCLIVVGNALLINDALPLKNFKLGDYGDRMYPTKYEIKDTTDTARSALYLDTIKI